MAQTFLPGVRNWNTSVSRRDIEVFDPQARQSCLHDTWQLYDIIHPKIVVSHLKLSINGAVPQIGQYNPAKKHLWNYEVCSTRHKHIVMNLILHSICTSFQSLQCQSRIERKSLPNRIQNFDSNVVLRAMVMFRELTLNKVRHCRSTPYELAFMSIIVWKEMYSTYRWQTANYLKPSLTWNRAETGSNIRQPCSQGRVVFHRHLGKREDPGDEVDSNPGGQPGGLTGDTLRLFVGSSGFPCCRCRGSGGVGWRFHNTFTSTSWWHG